MAGTTTIYSASCVHLLSLGMQSPYPYGEHFKLLGNSLTTELIGGL